MGKIGRFICPACNAVNVQSGDCFKCGANLEVPEQPAAAGSAADQADYDDYAGHRDSNARHLRSMQGGPGLTRQQMIMIAVGVLLLAAVFMMMGGGGGGGGGDQPATVEQPGQAPGTATSGAVDKAVAVAVRYAGFKDKAPPNWEYVDTSDITGDVPSFGMKSERSGQNVLFVVWDNTGVVQNLDLVLNKVPFMPFYKVDNIRDVRVDSGEQLLGEGEIKWFVGRYRSTENNKLQMAFVGAYKSPIAGKAMVVVARPLNPEVTEEKKEGLPEPAANIDYRTVIWLIDTMASGYTAAARGEDSTIKVTGAGKEKEPEAPLATAQQLEAYAASVETLLSEHFKAPTDLKDEKVKLQITIGPEGKVTKMEISAPSGVEALDNAAVKAITASQPYAAVPRTKEGSVKLRVTASGAKIDAELD